MQFIASGALADLGRAEASRRSFDKDQQAISVPSHGQGRRGAW
jgi:hypothetical protein